MYCYSKQGCLRSHSASPNATLGRTILILLIITCSSAAAPQITGQPQSQSVLAGIDVGLSVDAVSPTGFPLTYQWTKNGLTVTNATNSVLLKTNVLVPDSGTYCVSS